MNWLVKVLRINGRGDYRQDRVRFLAIVVFLAVLVFYGISRLLLGATQPAKAHYQPSPLAQVIDQSDISQEQRLTGINTAMCQHPQNPIVQENCQPGSEDWVIRKNSFQILGFASGTSANIGDTIQFFIDTPSPKYTLTIFRMGYYAGKGGRLIKTYPSLDGTRQPPCLENFLTGLTSCSNWHLSFTLSIPADWVSGVYIAKLVQEDTGGENYIPFVVRNDASHADILYQQSVATYQAYNNYGGKSLYTENSNICNTVSSANRAVEVSFDRPYNAPMGDPSTFFRAEYPMVRWLEAQGYWVTYSTDIDTDQSGQPGSRNALLDHKLFLMVGHDEYWSIGMRTAITAARDAGVSLGVFSGNTSYWSARFTSDPWSGKAERTMVVYKTAESGGPDPSGIPTSTWRDPLGNFQPENGLLGIQYIGDNETNSFPLRVYAANSTDPLFSNTGLDHLPAGSYVDIGHNLVGWEWDALANNGATPAGVKVLFDSPVFGEQLQDAGNDFLLGQAQAQSTYYVSHSGAFVFNSGTIQWSWGLDLYEPDVRIQQITYNILRRMGANPAAPGPDLVLGPNQSGQGASRIVSVPKFASNPPVISQIDLEISGRNQAVLRWQTDKPSDSQAWYWIANSEGYFEDQPVFNSLLNVADPRMEKNHELILSNLVLGQEYHVQLAGLDEDGNITLTSPQTIKTPQGNLSDQIISGYQNAEMTMFCRAKPEALPLYDWFRQLMIDLPFHITI